MHHKQYILQKLRKPLFFSSSNSEIIQRPYTGAVFRSASTLPDLAAAVQPRKTLAMIWFFRLDCTLFLLGNPFRVQGFCPIIRYLN